MMCMKKIFLFLSIVLLIYSLANILSWFNDSNSIAKESENLIDAVATNTANTMESNDIDTSNSSVDFTSLEQINSDVVRMDRGRWY